VTLVAIKFPIMTGYSKKLINIFIKDFSPGSFTDYLGIRSQKFAPLVSTTQISFPFKVPAHLCLPVQNKPCLSASATMALFDEYSSMCLMMKDRNVRGGVSVVLTADMHSLCPANADVTIITTATKIGKTIGFCDVKMVDKDGKLIASGSHVKYIDMGKVWDYMMQPSVIGYTMKIYDIVGEKLRGTPLGDKLLVLFGKKEVRHASTLEPPFVIVGAAYEDFGLAPLNDTTDDTNKENMRKHAVHVKPHMCNYFGKLHGGAAAMIAEYCAMQATFNGESNTPSTLCMLCNMITILFLF
jgi:acyl-coenzyme A thioesterase PaaI-like protein